MTTGAAAERPTTPAGAVGPDVRAVVERIPDPAEPASVDRWAWFTWWPGQRRADGVLGWPYPTEEEARAVDPRSHGAGIGGAPVEGALLVAITVPLEVDA